MERIDLGGLVEEQLAKARAGTAGRSAVTVHGGRESVMRQTVVALREGAGLDAHDSPGEATLQVLRGRIRFTTLGSGAETSTELAAGEYAVLPPERHAVAALDDAAILLTVGLHEGAALG